MDRRPAAAAFDLDGTLAPSKAPMDPSMGALLSKLDARMPVAIISGGSRAQFDEQLLPGMPEGTDFRNFYLFPESSGQCLMYANGSWRTLYDEAFTPEERTAVLKALDESLAETELAEAPAQVWGERIEDRGAEITFSGLGQHAPQEEKMKWDPDQSLRRPLADALKKRLPHFSIRINSSSSIDITREGVTKAYGIKQFSRLAGIPPAEILYVGDGLFPGGNDEMVNETGAMTRAVSGPAETAAVIEELLGS